MNVIFSNNTKVCLLKFSVRASVLGSQLIKVYNESFDVIDLFIAIKFGKF